MANPLVVIMISVMIWCVISSMTSGANSVIGCTNSDGKMVQDKELECNAVAIAGSIASCIVCTVCVAMLAMGDSK